MDYVPPLLEELIASVAKVKQKYKKEKRRQDINFLEKTTELFLDNQGWEQLGISEQQLHYAALGMWTFCRETIPKAPSFWDRYHFLKPDYREGYIWNQGSSLYTIYGEEMHISETNVLDCKREFIYLEHFYNLFFNPDPKIQEKLSPWKEWLKQNYVPAPQLDLRCKNLMTELADTIPSEILRIVHAIPTDKSIHEKMSHLWDDYIDKKKLQAENSYFARFKKASPQRKFTSQLGQAIAKKLPPDDEDDELSRPQRIHMGALYFIMELINSECWIKTPRHSELYKLCSDALNREIEKYPQYTEYSCLTAFRTFINENETLDAIERHAKNMFSNENHIGAVDAKLDPLYDELESYIKAARSNTSTNSNFRATYALGRLGAELFAAPFWAIGTLVALMVGESNTMVRPKVQTGQALTTLGSAALGISHNYLGLMAAGYLIQTGLIRFLGKTFEAGGKAVGFGLFAPAGLFIDLIRDYILVNIFLYEKCGNPLLIKKVDMEFFKSCLRSPKGVLKADIQKHLEKLQKENFEPEESNQNILRLTM